MSSHEVAKTAEEEPVQEEQQQKRETPKKEYYLDPEGGYDNPEIGKQAELAAMTKQAPVSVNNLPTKAYLEKTITPTVLRALSEVSKARPDNPIEFVAYYLLKHNPNRELKNEGTPIGHRHPDDTPPETLEVGATIQSTDGAK